MSKSFLKKAQRAIKTIFDKLVIFLLGPKIAQDNNITADEYNLKNINDENPLEKAYTNAFIIFTGHKPTSKISQNSLITLNDTAIEFVNKAKKKFSKELKRSLEKSKNPEQAKAIILDFQKKINNYASLLFNSEIRSAQAFAERDAILSVAEQQNISDPTVVKLGVVDHKICEACKILWHHPQNLFLPRPWKLSELQHGYTKNLKDPTPTVLPTHPNCRHILSIVPPNYGFNANGQIVFVHDGFDYYQNFYFFNKKENFRHILECIHTCTCNNKQS